MKPDPIAQLRADSLAATRSAARGRRVRRRVRRIALATIVLAAAAFSFLPSRAPAPARRAAAPSVVVPVVPPVVAEDRHIIRTSSHTAIRIAPGAGRLVRVRTEPGRQVERIVSVHLNRPQPEGSQSSSQRR